MSFYYAYIDRYRFSCIHFFFHLFDYLLTSYLLQLFHPFFGPIVFKDEVVFRFISVDYSQTVYFGEIFIFRE